MSLPKEVAAEISKIRQKPASYIPILEDQLKYFKGNNYCLPGKITLVTNEGRYQFLSQQFQLGPSAVKECIEFLKVQKALSGLQWNNNLAQAAQDHADDIGPKGISGHNGSNGSTMSSRMEKYGDWNGQIGENISFGEMTAQGVVAQLIVDDGVSSRGHRKNIFNENFKICGIGSQAHKTYEICVVQDFAQEYTEKGKMSEPKAGKVEMKKPEEFKQGAFESSDSNVVKTSTSTSIKTTNGKKVTTVTVVQTMADGSTKTTVNTTTEG